LARAIFFQISSRLTKGTKATSAKTAVIFSKLPGMFSGSAAGNAAVTGTMTIPMMKRESYQPHQAAAIDAVVSTGGHIMPPVISAAAFIMAEIIGVPYSSITLAALIPAILFFTSIFFMVHLQGESIGIDPAPRSKAEPPVRLTSRQIVEGARPNCRAIAHKECLILIPRDISSRSETLNA
jgi:TRAP-type uncharacterized transport system fused permease subunit